MKPAARAVALAAMAGTLCASPVLADDAAKSPAPPNATSAMRVVVDPETGEVRAPTEAELKAQLQRENAAAAARGAARSSARAQSTHVLPAEKVVQRHPNGMLSVRMSQETLSLLKARRANGELQIAHEGETAEHVHVAAEEK